MDGAPRPAQRLSPCAVLPGPTPTLAAAALQRVRAAEGRLYVDLGAIIDGQPQRAQSWAALVVAQRPWAWD
jgi:hypothetical protein